MAIPQGPIPLPVISHYCLSVIKLSGIHCVIAAMAESSSHKEWHRQVHYLILSEATGAHIMAVLMINSSDLATKNDTR